MGSPTEAFLSLFFGDEISKSDRLVLWTLHNKRHQWFDSIDEAVRASEETRERDTYFGVGLYPKGVTKRLQDNVSCIFGVWLDIDCGDKDNGKSYFKTTEDAIGWVYDTLCNHWSIIVHSGSGLHVYLLFDEPFYINDETTRLAARQLEAAFHSWANSVCPFDLDPVIDLSRIMRLPGTKNTKSKSWCEVVDARDFRVAATDLLDSLPSVSLTETGHMASIDGDIDIKDILERVSMIAGVDLVFSDTWHRKRRFGDQSPSSYCMSLANQLAMAGFSDSEIFAALKLWRERQVDAGEKPDSWYEATISKARQAHNGEKHKEKFEAILTSAVVDDEPEINEKASSMVFGAPLQRIVKIKPAEHKGISGSVKYRLEFECGNAMVENTAALLNQGYMKQRLFETLGIVMKTMKGAQYDKILQLLLNMMEHEEEAAEANPAFSLEQELKAYVAAKIAQCEVCTDLGLYQRGQLFKDEDDSLWFGFEPFRMKLQSIGSHKSKNEIAPLLRGIGSYPKQMLDKGRTRLWLVPEDCR